MPSRYARRQLARVLAAPLVALLLAGLALAGLHGGVFQGFRQQASDALFPTGATSNQIAVVGIDAHSLDAEHQAWPWPRTLQARLLDDLTADGASVVVEDLVFNPAAPGDAALGAAVRRSGHVVLAEAPVLRPDPDGLLLEESSDAAPTPAIARGAAAVGHTGIVPDPSDGVVRTVPLVVEDKIGHFVPSVALAALMVKQHLGGVITLRPHAVVVGKTSIPTGDRHSLTVSFSSGVINAARVISAADVLSDKVARSALAGKVVFVGVTDPTLGDNHLVPPRKQSGLPGVVLDAATLNTMLTGSYVHDASFNEIALVVFVLALLAGLSFLYLRLILAAPALAIVVAAYAWWVFRQFNHGQVDDLVYPFAGVVVAVIAAVATRYLTESRQQRRVAALFSSYVPDTVAQQLIRDDLVDDVVSGRRSTITAFFCDLRGFTPLAASLAPADVRRVLDLYYDHVCSRILTRDGTIMQFVGDEVFAVFGAPLDVDDHCERAYRTAAAVQSEAGELAERLSQAGLPGVSFGIGLHSGEVVAAHVGPAGRKQYSVVGDPVNVGSRLCGQAAVGEVVMSEAVYAGLKDTGELVDSGLLQLKGVAGGVHCYRLPER